MTLQTRCQWQSFDRLRASLVTKINPDGSKIIYVGGIYEENKDSGGIVQQTRTYYPAAGAMRINNDLYYILKDHLGSASVVTYGFGSPSQIGTIVPDANVRYLPFGEALSDTDLMLTDKLFTGQREIKINGIDELSIYHYGARFYSPKLGRFLSPDTTAPNLDNPQKLNHYSYVLNNPLRYSDPTGNRECDYDCQVEYYGADPDYEHYCEACEWDVAEQRRNEEVVETVLYGGLETVASTLVEPVDWALTGYHCVTGDCSPWVLAGFLPFVSGSTARRLPELFRVVRYGDKFPGFARHHGVLDVWAAQNIPGYVSRNPDAPTVLLTPQLHERTNDVFRSWRKDLTGSIVGKIDWTTVSPRTIQRLAESMFDATGVPNEARQTYYRELNRYLYEVLP